MCACMTGACMHLHTSLWLAAVTAGQRCGDCASHCFHGEHHQHPQQLVATGMRKALRSEASMCPTLQRAWPQRSHRSVLAVHDIGRRICQIT